MTVNQVAYWNLLETNRSNLVRELETERHNRETEKAQHKSANAAATQAAAAMRNADTNYANMLIAQQKANTDSERALLEQDKHDLDVTKHQFEVSKWNDVGREATKTNIHKTLTDAAKNAAQTAVLEKDAEWYWYNHLFTSGTAKAADVAAKLLIRN